MAKFLADRIMKGLLTIEDVPAKLRDEVEQILRGEQNIKH